MMIKMDKRIRAEYFRKRLAQAMEKADFNRSTLARATGADRSTISQLLADGETRLPNAQLVAECASVLGVSADWLLSLTEHPERPGDLIDASVRIANAERTSTDEQLLAWHHEAKGYKIRHVPATLPDLLKTEAVLSWEYEAFLSKTPDQAIGAKTDRLSWLRSGESDYEIALPRHEIEAFAAGHGYYAGLPEAVREEQLDVLQAHCTNFFPSLRVFFFDARKLFSAPVTIFGPMLGVVYVGRFYLAFRSEKRVRSLVQHFDWLVRECDIDARQAGAFIREVAATNRS